MKKYLFEELKERPYPFHQYMDKETIIWLKNKLEINYKKNDILRIIFDYQKFPINDLDINIEYYAQNNSLSIHGIRHQIRVSIYIWLLINYLKIKISKSDFTTLLQASLYHDIKRINDNEDLNHGFNSAIWINEHYPFIKTEIIKAIENHDKSLTNYNIYDRLIKTADALDRYRLPKEKWWIRKEYFLLNINDEILEFAKFITTYIEENTYYLKDYQKIIDEVKKCLKKLEII